MIRYLLFLTGFALSLVAAFYSVTGLAFVFAGAFVPVVIMGSTLEAGKLVAASWLFRSWRTAPKWLAGYLTLAVLLLMLLTGIGIFGYLSRAYLMQQAPLTQTTADITSAQRAVDLAQAQYERDVRALQELSAGQTTDKVISKLAETDRLTGSSGAVSVLRTQQSLQQAARKQVQASSAELATAQKAFASAQSASQLQTVDLGPLMFAAKAWYGTSDVDTMDKIVRWFILLIMLVFDPLAIALLLAAQQTTPHTPARMRTPARETTPSPSADDIDMAMPTDTETESLADTDIASMQFDAPRPTRRGLTTKRGMKAATTFNLRS